MDDDTTNPTDRNPAAKHGELGKAVAAAYTLQAYAAEQGLEIDPDAVKSILEARRAQADGTLSAELEVAFWSAFRSVAKAVEPVTVDSIRAVDPLHGERKGRWIFGLGEKVPVSRAQLAARRYRLWIVGILLATLVFQIFWLLGANTVNHIRELEKAIAAVNINDKSTASDILARDANLEKLNAHQNILSRFLVMEKFFLPNYGDDVDRAQTFALVSDSAMQNVLSVLQLFVLPIGYGLLGAGAFVIRRISEAVAAMSFDPDHMVGYGLRFFLGSLAGLTIAWFLPSDLAIAATGNSTGQSVSLKPTIDFSEAVGLWAAAFLAGYSVELLFAAMDRLVGNLSAAKKPGG